MKPFQIEYNNSPVSFDRIDRDTFCVHLPDRELRIQYRADNEGADHWLDLDTDQETEQTKTLGEQLGKFVEK